MGTPPRRAYRELGTNRRDAGNGPRTHAERGPTPRSSRFAVLAGAVLTTLLIASCGTGATPRPTPAPVMPPPTESGGPRLSWAPPALEAPETIALEPGATTTDLEPDRDYILTIPRTGKGDTFVRGGRNIVIIGGHISTGRGQAPWSSPEHRALYFADTTGTIHVEGVLIDDIDSGQGDGIAIAAPGAVLQVQNVRITGLTGKEQGNHADVLQLWGGVKEVRVDRLTGSTDYQGLHVQPDLGPIGRVTIRNANVSSTSSTAGNWLIWLATGSNSCQTAGQMNLDDVYVTPRPGRSLGDSVWPPSDPADAGDARNPVQTCLSALSADGAELSFPALPRITGVVRQGPPQDGDFVPEGVAGPDYVSPGYVR